MHESTSHRHPSLTETVSNARLLEAVLTVQRLALDGLSSPLPYPLHPGGLALRANQSLVKFFRPTLPVLPFPYRQLPTILAYPSIVFLWPFITGHERTRTGREGSAYPLANRTFLRKDSLAYLTRQRLLGTAP